MFAPEALVTSIVSLTRIREPGTSGVPVIANVSAVVEVFENCCAAETVSAVSTPAGDTTKAVGVISVDAPVSVPEPVTSALTTSGMFAPAT